LNSLTPSLFFLFFSIVFSPLCIKMLSNLHELRFRVWGLGF
jgi:hypothetical protein